MLRACLACLDWMMWHQTTTDEPMLTGPPEFKEVLRLLVRVQAPAGLPLLARVQLLIQLHLRA